MNGPRGESIRPVTGDELKEYAGRSLLPSEWMTVTQEQINGFADVTDDHQFIHVDEAAASATPLGSTIAHGFLTLSLLSVLQPVRPARGCEFTPRSLRCGRRGPGNT